MKTKINFFQFLTLAILLMTGVTANAQTEFAPIGAEWYYNCCAEGGNILRSHFNYIVSEKDTVIEGNSCRVLRRYSDNSNIANGEYIIKQEKGKIYYYYQDKFNLLFDFDAKVNDTVEFTYKYQKYHDDFPMYTDTIFSARYQVESITTNAQNLKTFGTKILEEDKFAVDGMEILPWYYLYSEKIGFSREFMPVLDNLAHPAEDLFPMLRCYSDADFSFISDEWAATSLPYDYSFATGINAASKDENIKTYPNPFNDNIFVFTDYDGNIEIIDVSGKIIYSSKLLKGINEIPTSYFIKGIYFAKIQNKDSIIKILKIIK